MVCALRAGLTSSTICVVCMAKPFPWNAYMLPWEKRLRVRSCSESTRRSCPVSSTAVVTRTSRIPKASANVTARKAQLQIAAGHGISRRAHIGDTINRDLNVIGRASGDSRKRGHERKTQQCAHARGSLHDQQASRKRPRLKEQTRRQGRWPILACNSSEHGLS